MLTLAIEIDLGPHASPARVEALVKAVRVAADLSYRTEVRRVRRAAAAQMRFPTDAELRDAIERLPQSDETGPSYRARVHLDARAQFAEDAEELAPWVVWDYFNRRRRHPDEHLGYLSEAGYERAMEPYPRPWGSGGPFGLDVIDPTLYQALVAERVARLAPGEITVREMHYGNPFSEVVAGVGAAEKVVKTTAGVIETTATLGSRRRLKKAEARIAEATVDDQIRNAKLDTELKVEELRRARIENEAAEQEVLRRRIENAEAMDALDARRRQRRLVDHFLAAGELDLADEIAAADPSEAAALVEFSLRPPQLETNQEPDPEDEADE